MDLSFFSQYLLTVARFRHSRILLKKEQRYYYRYMLKLSYNLEHLGTNNIDKALEYIDEFEFRQGSRVKDGFFIKPRKVLQLACQDSRDVLKSMERWDGVENWECSTLKSRSEF